jgi:hypothetical protein
MSYRPALAGVGAALVYGATVLVGGAITPGYSHVRDHVSTLIQAGAQKAPLLVPPFLVYNLLTLAMGLALVVMARRSALRHRRLGVLSGWALVVEGLVGALTLAFPQDPIGSPVTTAGATHIALAAASSLLTMVAVGLGGAWLLTAGALRPAAWYSLVTLAVIFGFGVITAVATANLDPLMGLYERVTIFAFIQWLFVIGLVLATQGPPTHAQQLEST